MTKLLIVDDDRELCSMLTELLKADRLEVDAVYEGGHGVIHVKEGDYALVVLDVMLPDMNGLEVLRQIRKGSDVPVIMLTAKGDHVDRIVGLELGADDYLPKPFNSRELAARIQAVLRRSALSSHVDDQRERPKRYRVEDLDIDAGERSVCIAGTEVSLTTIEFDLLLMLVEAAGTPVERVEISRAVFDRPLHVFDRTIDVHISSLRRKIGARAGGGPRIQTIRGVGYLYVRPTAGTME
jgi:two-component system response regulator CpxR